MTLSEQGSNAGHTSLVDHLFDRDTPARPSHAMHPPLIWASIGAFLAAILALGVSFGPYTSSVATFLLCLVIIPGWPVLLGLTNRGTSRLVMILTLVVALPAAFFGTLATTMAAAVGAILLSFVVEMFRTDGRNNLIEHISGSVSGAMMIIVASLWIHAANLWDGDILGSNPGVLVGLTVATAIATAALIHGFDTDYANILGVVNAAAVATLTSYLLAGPAWLGLAIGAVVGLYYAFIRRGLRSFQRPLTWIQGVTKAAIPHCALGLIGFIFTWLLL